MDIAFGGTDPETGELLVDTGDRFVLYAICGDGDFLVNDLHFPHWNNDDICLGRCLTQKSPGPFAYNEFRPSVSKWIQNALTTDYLVHTLLTPHRHPWMSVRGVTVFTVAMDTLHNLDQNGIRSHLLGNLLFEFVYHLNGKQPRKVALALVWERILQGYSDLNVKERVGRLTVDMFTDSDKPHQTFP